MNEAALNAYLATTLKVARSNATEAASVWRMNLDGVNLAFRSNLTVMTTVAHWGPLNMTWELAGVPRVVDDRFVFAVSTVRCGHLELPKAVAEWVGTQMTGLFNRWQADRQLLAQLGEVTVQAGGVTLVTRPAGRKP